MNKDKKQIGFWGAAAIGIGGMVGGGIFAVLGLSVQLAHGGAPIAFALGGIVALLTAYSYSRLSVTFPSQGGTVTFLDRAFGPTIPVGAMNILLWLSYIVMLSLYASAFGSYGAAFASQSSHVLVKHILIVAGVVLISGLNLMSAEVIGKAETWIVGIKITILLFFIAVGISQVQVAQISPSAWAPPVQIIAGGMIIFLAYEGFELIANTADDVKNPHRLLPRAFMFSVLFVIFLYILIAAVATGTLSVDKIVAAQDYALAVAAEPTLGKAGFILIACAALLSTSSAMNATFYGAARLSYIIAKEGELPEVLEKKVWNRPAEGLLITAAATLLVANLFDVSSISTMGSAGFLLIFAAVNAANLKLRKDTGSNLLVPISGVVSCLGALLVLLWQTYRTKPAELFTLAIMLGLSWLVEWLYRRFKRGALRFVHKPARKPPEPEAQS
ncbi:MAG TPA: APC family permease [candidate division Zixibacteria bacterium]|nr:APC family permease [candidate division Zixibacteria bacterium]